MGTIYNAFHKIVPFSTWFQMLGLSEAVSEGLSILLIALIIWLLKKATSLLVQRRKNQKTARDLKPQFDYQMVRQATRYYIPTQYQNASPARQDEPGFTHKYVSRSLLIPFFIKTAFNERVDSERFYLILADSGMGKTTFMINLYIRYHSFFNRHRNYKMRLFRFSHPDTLAEIRAIKGEEAKNTILLLDALDEDRNIVSKDPNISDAQAFQNRVDEIIEATRNFCEVVMTCRTQYFPGQEDDPYELKIKRPDEKGYYILNKLYISPFNEKEVKQYLNKKFGYLPLRNRAKKKRAAQVVGQARHLVMRPMMLSYIDYLLEDNRSYRSDFDIYETLIEKWLERETKKRKQLSDQKAFKDNLRLVSQQTAVAIFHNWQADNRLYLTKEQALAIATKHEIELKPEEVTGQSLLTCDGLGYWKFAHKSILEYFLAKEAVENRGFNNRPNFTGMDMAKRFLEEKIPENFVFIEGGEYVMGGGGCNRDESYQAGLSNFWINKYPVTQAEYVEVVGKSNPSQFKNKDRNPVESISWKDAINYCNLLNKKHGFSATYDTHGHLLDVEGQVTTNIGKVRGFRLPTEAEWEFAARGGKQSKGYEYSGSENVEEVAWFSGNSNGKTHPVGNLKPNELGLYDMSGNVWEWCYDWYGDYPLLRIENPIGLKSGSNRVVRGGSWFYDARDCRTAPRYYNDPDYRSYNLGFRLVFVL